LLGIVERVSVRRLGDTALPEQCFAVGKVSGIRGVVWVDVLAYFDVPDNSCLRGNFEPVPGQRLSFGLTNFSEETPRAIAKRAEILLGYPFAGFLRVSWFGPRREGAKAMGGAIRNEMPRRTGFRDNRTRPSLAIASDRRYAALNSFAGRRTRKWRHRDWMNLLYGEFVGRCN
jgi:hypothetical protein